MKAELKVDVRNMSKDDVQRLSSAFGGKLTDCPYVKKVKKGWASDEWFCTAETPERWMASDSLSGHKNLEKVEHLCKNPRNWPDCPQLVARHSGSRQG